MHQPDNWVLVKISLPDEEPFFKVLAGWSGGYLDGDSWRMNSGVSKVEEDGDFYLFYGDSGSVYKCHKESETLRMNNAHIYDALKKSQPDVIDLINYVDFKNEFVSN